MYNPPGCYEESMKYHLFTDGACQPNPGKGGWAFIVYPETHPKKRAVRSGYEAIATNNRMEITAVLEGLKYISRTLNDSPEITLFSDSKYILGAINSWMEMWVKNNWKRKDKKPVLNDDLWRQMHFLSEKISISCIHIKGHSGHPENEECDQLAVVEIQRNK